MIVRHDDWAPLTAELRTVGGVPEAMPQGVTRAVLAGPCAVAWWIAHRAPHLASRETLSLLIVGAETADAPDQGRWYQLLPTLLGAPSLHVTVTLVGLELDLAFASSAAAFAPHVAAHGSRTSLGHFLRARADAPFDLAFAFHPGLQKHRGWLGSDAFPRLIARTPLVCVAYGQDEYEMERWVVEAYGFGADSAALVNPFYLDVSDARTSIRWAHVLWSIDTAPAPDHSRDERRLEALDTLNRMVMHSMVRSQVNAPAFGTEVALVASDGTRRPLVHVADNRFMDAISGQLLKLHEGSLEVVGSIDADAASYPGAAASELERALWAAQLKSVYLLGTYDDTEVEAPPHVAGRMLVDLRTRLARLFRG